MILSLPPGYHLIRTKGHCIWLREKSFLPQILPLLDHYRRERTLPQAEILKEDSPALVLGFPMEGKRWVWKAYRPRPVWRRLWDRMVYSRAFYATAMASCFWGKGISTPLPLAAISGDSRAGSYLITPYLEDMVDGRELLKEILPGSPQGALFLEELSSWTASLHSKGLYHGDLKSVNILVKKSTSESKENVVIKRKPWEFWGIDLDTAVVKKNFSFAHAARDLSTLLAYTGPWAKEKGILRFALKYEKAMNFSRAEGQKLFLLTLEKLGKRIRKGKSCAPGLQMPFAE